MRLAGLWRYPVKSLAGEPLVSAYLTTDGIAGDRLIHVRGRRGLLTGRTRPGLLTLNADTGPDGVPRVAGHPWHTPAARRLVRQRAGPDAELVRYEGRERFDVLNLLVATDSAVQALGYDVRRLRPNLLIAGVADDAERTWPGRAIVIGEALIGVHSVRQRCIVTTIDPDSGTQDLDVLRRIRRSFGGRLALDCWVIKPGAISVGDPVGLVSTSERPRELGGWVTGAPYTAAG
jgi:uncharacterized protein